MSNKDKKPTSESTNKSSHIGDRKIKGFAMEIPPPPKTPSIEQPKDNNNDKK